MKLIKKLYNLFKPKIKCVKSTLSEIEHVQIALERYRNIIDKMNEVWVKEGAPCCPRCYYGGNKKYNDLLDKIERVEKQLIILKARKLKKENKK